MNLHPEHRHRKRFNHVSIVTLEDHQQGHFIYGQTKDMSADGICVKADYAIRPGTLVDVTIDKLPYKSNRKQYRAIAKWCDVVDNDHTMYSYEIGMKFL